MLEKKEFDRAKKQVLEWIPDKIIDSHIHTGIRAGNVPPEKAKPHPISYRLFRNNKLSVPVDIFNPIFPDSKIEMIGFPLPSPE